MIKPAMDMQGAIFHLFPDVRIGEQVFNLKDNGELFRQAQEPVLVGILAKREQGELLGLLAK